jgi:IS30 family transposase
MQSGETHVELKALQQHGWSVSQLAREFGLSRTTVYKELANPAPRIYRPRDCPMDFTAAQVIYVEQRLVVCPGIRGTDLHAELRYHY